MSNKSKNKNIDLLCTLNLSSKNSFEFFNESTRDSSDLEVLKCNMSGVIVLKECLITDEYYENNTSYATNFFRDNTVTVNGVIKSQPLEDDIRRFETHKDLITGSRILDFGCGRGDFIRLSKEVSKQSVGLEINNTNREFLNNNGIECVSSLSELNDEKFDLITLFHVFEHLNDPINILSEIKKYLKDDGIIIIEVPNAKDILLETFNLKSFKNFILWSEHLILHTKGSLEAFASNSGLKTRNIKGIQRYPISNHFNWLLNNQPSGHEIFSSLNNDEFHEHYEIFLDKINQTDTIIGYFNKNI